MKLFLKSKTFVVFLFVILLGYTSSTNGQEITETTDRTEFHKRYDSLLDKVEMLGFSDSGISIKYYFRWTSSYSQSEIERFGIVSIFSDSLRESFKMRPYVKGNLFGTTVKIDSFVDVKVIYPLGKEIFKSISQLIYADDYFIQPTKVNNKNYYPLNVIRVFTISKGSDERMGFAKHGRSDVSIVDFKLKEDLDALFKWLFDIGGSNLGNNPRMKECGKISHVFIYRSRDTEG